MREDTIPNIVAFRGPTLEEVLRTLARQNPTLSFGVFWDRGRWVIVGNAHDGEEEVQIVENDLIEGLKAVVEFVNQRKATSEKPRSNEP